MNADDWSHDDAGRDPGFPAGWWIGVAALMMMSLPILWGAVALVRAILGGGVPG